MERRALTRTPLARTVSTAWVVALVVAAAAILSMLAQSRDLRRTFAAGDFAAFYCGATVVRERLDPYRAAPLEACERARTAAPGSVALPDGIDPAPVPGYVLALFVPLSLLPFTAAAVVWYAFLIAVVVATVRVLRALTGLPRAAVLAAVLGTDIVSSLTYGQLSPLATLGVAAAALFLARERPRSAALACALVLLQPQVAIAPVASLLLWVPRARGAAVAVVAALALIALAALGFAANAEYVRSVVGAQALAEAPFDIQLSVTWLLVFFGLGEPAALNVAWVEYAVMLFAGVLLGRLLAVRLRRPEMLVVVPAAMTLMGGTYLHVFQLAAAVPCALVLAARVRVPAVRALAWVAVALLAVPWEATGSRLVVAMSAVAVATIAWTALAARPARTRALAAFAAVVFVALEPVAVARVSGAVVRPAPAGDAARFDRALASGAHGLALRARPARVDASWQTFARKTPEWTGLAALLIALACAAAAAVRRRGLPAT